jgi:cellulose synthase/poly-beta-1,6-N-acetylglucosamine synthase-like glycosyltransferase
LFYSFIIPCFNRADEVHELLESFSKLKVVDGTRFEIIFVDGSPTEILKPVIEAFKTKLPIHHEHKPKLPISPSRNLGAQLAEGDYLIFLDSDVILPEDYLVHVNAFLQKTNADSFGGPDKAHETFTDTQKAISYAMTSFLTTGGIRGGKQHIHQYNPRGFNMGIRKSVFDAVQGYSKMTCGEDIELSVRIIEAGYVVKLNPEAYVYHKRRSTFKSFFRQVFRFGAARINIFQRHRSELKITHMFPAAFVLYLVVGLVSSVIFPLVRNLFLASLGIYLLMIFLHSTSQNKSFVVGLKSILASLLQLTGYGFGFLSNAFSVFVLGKKDGMALGASK